MFQEFINSSFAIYREFANLPPLLSQIPGKRDFCPANHLRFPGPPNLKCLAWCCRIISDSCGFARPNIVSRSQREPSLQAQLDDPATSCQTLDAGRTDASSNAHLSRGLMEAGARPFRMCAPCPRFSTFRPSKWLFFNRPGMAGFGSICVYSSFFRLRGFVPCANSNRRPRESYAYCSPELHQGFVPQSIAP